MPVGTLGEALVVLMVSPNLRKSSILRSAENRDAGLKSNIQYWFYCDTTCFCKTVLYWYIILPPPAPPAGADGAAGFTGVQERDK